MIGVDTAKDLLHGQLSIAQPGPGYVHFSQDLPREWYEQLTAEQRIVTRAQGGESMRWVKRRPRNEKLDCRNYATHAAHMLGLHTMGDAAWQRLEALVQPPPDLFSPRPIEVPAAAARPRSTTTETGRRGRAAATRHPGAGFSPAHGDPMAKTTKPPNLAAAQPRHVLPPLFAEPDLVDRIFELFVEHFPELQSERISQLKDAAREEFRAKSATSPCVAPRHGR